MMSSRKVSALVSLMFLLVTACGDSASQGSGSGDSSWSRSGPSESDIEWCQRFLMNASTIEKQKSFDEFETALGMIQYSTWERLDAWQQILGVAEYEVSSLTFADFYPIRSAARDMERAYEDGEEVVQNSESPEDIADVLVDFFDAFGELKQQCSKS